MTNEQVNQGEDLLNLWKSLALVLGVALEEQKELKEGEITLSLPIKKAKLLLKMALDVLLSGAFGLAPPYMDGILEVGEKNFEKIQPHFPSFSSALLSEWKKYWEKNKSKEKIEKNLLSAVMGKRKINSLDKELSDWMDVLLETLDFPDHENTRDFIEEIKSSYLKKRLSKKHISQRRENGRNLMYSRVLEVAHSLIPQIIEARSKPEGSILKDEKNRELVEKILAEDAKAIIDDSRSHLRKLRRGAPGRPKKENP